MLVTETRCETGRHWTRKTIVRYHGFPTCPDCLPNGTVIEMVRDKLGRIGAYLLHQTIVVFDDRAEAMAYMDAYDCVQEAFTKTF